MKAKTLLEASQMATARAAMTAQSQLLATSSAQPALIDAYVRDAASAITADMATGQVTFGGGAGGGAGGGKTSRAERKALMRAVQKDLTTAGREQLDVSKLHPRWLRRYVEMAMERQEVTAQDVARWRAQGKQLALTGMRIVAEEKAIAKGESE